MQPKRNNKLWIKIRTQGMTQRDFSRLIGECDSVVSGAVNGKINLGESKQRKFAQALGCRVEDIFEA